MQDDLRQWVIENMTVDDKSVLMENKERVSQLVGITSEGKVVLKVEKESMNAQELVLVYLLGKLFANTAGYANEKSAKNSEIAEELGIPAGTVGRCLLELRKSGMARPVEGGHELVLSSLPSLLKRLK